MQFSYKFTKYFLTMLWYALPIIGVIMLLITVSGLILARLEGLSIGAGLYFAWITATTVGYGDFVPATATARVLAVALALVGVPLDGLIVACAIIAARMSVDRHGRLGRMVHDAEARLAADLEDPEKE